MTDNVQNEVITNNSESQKECCSTKKKCCKGKKAVRCILFSILAISLVTLVVTVLF